MNDNELMNRRRFFKKTAKEILPMLGAFVAAPTVIMNSLASCGPDGCDSCEAACRDNCVDSCKGSCSDSCSNGSGGGCSDCSSSCSASSTGSTCSSCANDCSSSCKETCQNTCKNTCSTSCEGSAAGKQTTGEINGHEYVDLGLSVLWATCNIGADSPEDNGTKFPFVYPNWYKEDDGGESWYRHFASLNLKPDDSISGTYLDIAKDKWGSKWRLPTDDEIRELWVNCKDELVPSVGMRAVSKINGKSILFPINFSRDNFNTAFVWSGDIVTYKFSNSDKEEIGAYGVEANQVDDGGYITDGKRCIAYRYYHERLYTYLYDVYLYPIRPVADRNNGDVSTCNGSCTAYCSSNCSSTCKNECYGTCKGSCGNDCTGSCKDGCSTGCKTTCKGECKEKCTKTCADNCSSNCTGKCTTTCADACKAQTSQYCSNCASNCSSGCTTTCADACKAQTSQGCSNCATQCSGDCQHECTYGCGRQCYTSCGGQCKGKCGGTCQVECTSYAKNTPCASCGGTCRSACNENCTYDCYSTCKSIGYK